MSKELTKEEEKQIIKLRKELNEPPKKLSPLEAFNELKYQIGDLVAYTHDFPPQITTYKISRMNLYKIIETALKDYEMEHTLRIRLENVNYNLVRKDEENQKKLEALEIIKQELIDMQDLIMFNSFSSFNQRRTLRGLKTISREKYDLLKEVLL